MSKDVQVVDPKLPSTQKAAPNSNIEIEETAPLKQDVRSTVAMGLFAVIIFFVVGGIWAGNAPLHGAAIISGVVSPESSRQTVQHLEGGIIKEYKVKEGDTVSKGDVLVVMDDTRFKAEANRLESRLRSLVATQARLEAELSGSNTIVFNHPLLRDLTDPRVLQTIEKQNALRQSRDENSKNRQLILNQRIEQLTDRIDGTKKQLAGTQEQIRLIEQERVGLQELFEKGFASKQRLLALERGIARLRGEEGNLISQMAGAEESIGETQLQQISLKIQRMEEVNAEIADTQTRRIEIEEALKTAYARLERTIVRAPHDGVVLDPRFKTVGAVVRSSQPLLDLVPTEDRVLINAQVRTIDIDDVVMGADASISFPSYPQRNLVRINGRVRQVSADTMQDPVSGAFFYTAKVEVDMEQLKEVAPDIKLTPGLPADVFVATVERTLLDYLFQPLRQTIFRAMRES